MKVLKAGLFTGFIINLIDVPNSILLGAPMLEKQLKIWGVTSHAAMPPYFVTLHFVLGLALIWLYDLLRQTGKSPGASCLISVGVLIGLNRLFGFGNVLIGNLPAPIFWAFSWSFVVGSLVGCALGGRMADRT